jgi:hypothetical protein
MSLRVWVVRGWISGVLALVAGAASAQIPDPELVVATLNAERCEILDPSHCLLPWPSDHFTIPDPSLDTGLRVNLDVLSMPRHTAGHPIRPDDYNRNDGWSPGAMILTLVEGIDLEASGAPAIVDMERSLLPESATVIVDTVTGEMHLHWAELDSHATSDATRLLILRPGVNLVEGRRYVVAVRNARDANGEPIPASPVFEAFRDRIPTGLAAIEDRRAGMEAIFALLEQAGVARDALHVAWDFTVGSERSLSERVLYMRDQAFAEIGSAAPTFAVTNVEEVDPAADDRIRRIVTGSFEVPRYLNLPTTGARMTFHGLQGQGPNLPDRYEPPQTANFLCTIPRSTSVDGNDPVTPARPSLYGHGLLGSAIEITYNNVRSMAHEHNFVFCATDWIGIAQEDLPTVVGIMIPDFSNWGTLPDRLQQAYLNFMFLGRLMIHPDGFPAHPAFQAGAANTPVIDTSELYYDGNSNGAVNGTALIALAQDFTKAVLGVGFINFSTILRRSVDFDPFKLLIDANFPSEIERTLVISLIQNIWDRGEGNGYAQHITRDPYPNTPVHRVLIHEGFGDHQVANVGTEVQARTVGAHVYQPALRPGRHSDRYPLHPGLPAIPSLPFDGSALVVWDSGTPTPPTNNVPPRDGFDSHEHPRNDPDARIQKSHFLSPTSRVVDVCEGAPCLVQQCGAVPCPLGP